MLLSGCIWHPILTISSIWIPFVPPAFLLWLMWWFFTQGHGRLWLPCNCHGWPAVSLHHGAPLDRWVQYGQVLRNYIHSSSQCSGFRVRHSDITYIEGNHEALEKPSITVLCTSTFRSRRIRHHGHLPEVISIGPHGCIFLGAAVEPHVGTDGVLWWTVLSKQRHIETINSPLPFLLKSLGDCQKSLRFRWDRSFLLGVGR